MSERLYSTFQVADLLGASPATVNEWIEKGWLPCQRFSDGPARITEAGLVEFLKQRGIDIETVMAKAVLREGRGVPPPPPAAAADRKRLPETIETSAAAEQPPPDAAVQIAEAVLRDAVTRRASAIHLEPQRGGLALRLRTDGVLHDKVNFRLRLPRTAAPSLLERFKSLAGLPPAGGPRGQTGSFALPVEGRQIAFRIATCPVAHGERMVIHVLDPDRVLPELSDLGMSAGAEARIREMLTEPCGIILIVAPGRRERTATLRAMVTTISAPERSIFTIAASTGPEIEGVNQSRIEPAGFSSAEAVTAAAEQDSDVVLVEEVRDAPTAAGILDLAGEGRMVLAGMAARNAPAAAAVFSRLCGEPLLLASSLLAVIEQTTARSLCEGCKRQAAPAAELLDRLGLTEVTFPVWAPVGCAQCANTGYAGTAVLPAILEVDQAIARSIRLSADARALEQAARLAGMKSLREVVLERLAGGSTSLEEIARVLSRRRLAYLTDQWPRGETPPQPGLPASPPG